MHLNNLNIRKEKREKYSVFSGKKKRRIKKNRKENMYG